MGDRRRVQREVIQQKRIVVFFCLMVFSVISVFILFGSIKAQAASAETMQKYYKSIQLKSGDTLWDISSEYMTDKSMDRNEYIHEICSMNHISADEIHAGQYIVIPYYSVEVLE